MTSALRLLLLAIAIACATWFIGWLSVPAIAAILGAAWHHHRGRAGLVALSAGFAWASLLAIDSVDGRLGALVSLLGGVFPAPGIVLVLLTLLFAMAAAWSAAVVASHAAMVLALRRKAVA